MNRNNSRSSRNKRGRNSSQTEANFSGSADVVGTGRSRRPLLSNFEQQGNDDLNIQFSNSIRGVTTRSQSKEMHPIGNQVEHAESNFAVKIKTRDSGSQTEMNQFMTNQIRVLADDELSEREDEEDVEEFDRIRTSVDPQEDQFSDEELDDQSDTEEGELTEASFVGVPGNSGNRINSQSIVDSDSEITFKLPVAANSTGVAVEQQTQQTDFRQFEGNPAFERYIQKMVAKEISSAKQKDRKRSAVEGKATAGPKQSVKQSEVTPAKVSKSGRQGNAMIVNQIKSPSDTTIYVPALQRLSLVNNVDKTKQIVEDMLSDNHINGKQAVLADQISQFIEGVRSEGRNDDVINNEPQPSTSGRDNAERPEQGSVTEARDKATQLILDAERFKASVNVPPGEIQNTGLISNLQLETQNMSQVIPYPQVQLPGNHTDNQIQEQIQSIPLNDDDFFHVTCHVDNMLRTKIERGEFVELERLLPKQRSISGGGDDNRMNLIHKDGQVYFVPATVNNRIHNVRRWEQAFHIYAAIYSQANPSRAAEIWQYVHTINVTASGYAWDNVAHYDVTFRHLMSQNPARSWSKIYNQMWNMAMRDVLPRNNTNFGQQNNNQSSQRRASNGGNSKKPKYCWAHNKGNCKDSAEKCKFIHRCSYCDNGDHIKTSCPKK